MDRHNDIDPHIWGRIIDEPDQMYLKDVYSRGLWPIIEVPHIHRCNENILEKLKEHVQKLKNYSHGDTRGHYIRCDLCRKDFEIIPDLKMHLLSKLHKDLEFQLN